ncbi:MAG: ATP-dependent DNA helicase UvrD2, partial [Acidimicrobiia bacterium]|nr:ATP-dependent DNA helicase UvrD2 [Acidimicrobiia bacterium]
KTRVLTRRIAHRAASGALDPRHVLALTFTRKAAGELATRLAALGLRDRPTAGTFHAVALSQLSIRASSHGWRPPVLLERKGRLLAQLLGKATRMTVPELAAEIEWAKARRVSPDDYPAAAHGADRRTGPRREQVASMYRAYEDEKRSRRVVDFDDLLADCARAMEEDRSFADAQRWRFRHLFVDEFQDVNPLQHHLLSCWLGQRDDLCVVGDPNQAIYGWNGADASFLRDFPSTHGGRVVELTDNYRSSPEILSVAAAVLERAQPLRAHRPGGPVPSIVTYPSDTDEALGIARAVRDQHQPTGRWGRQAVLVRTNAQTTVIEEALARARIPYRLRGAAPFLSRPAVVEALASLAGAAGNLAAALGELAAEVPRGDDLTDHDREAAGHLDALVQLGEEFLTLEPAGTVGDLRRWLAATVQPDDVPAGTDAVEVVTFHAAKGLEWPVVHVAGLEDGYVPVSHARTPEARAEERRLLYVAVTRAEEVLRCTWAEQRRFGQSLVERRPSPFLDALAGATAAIRAAVADVDHDSGLARARAHLDLTSHHGQGGHGHTDLLIALHDWRDRTARRARVPASVVLADESLVELAERRPSSVDELGLLGGVGPVKAAEYGATILDLVAAHPPD